MSEEETQTQTATQGSEMAAESPAAESIEQPAVQEARVEPTSPDGSQAESETSQEPSPELPQGNQMDVDEMGVPWKNRYHESQRKLDKAIEQINAVSEKIDKSQGQQRGEYSIEELEAFAETTDNDGHRAWAKGEIRKLQKEEVSKGIRNELNAWKAEQAAERVKSEALQTVMSRHPNAFRKNAQGQFVGWDSKSPLAQRIGYYMQDPEIKNNPRGLLVASAMAFQDIGTAVTNQAVKQTTQAKAEVKNLQKKTLTEGGGVSSPPQPKTPTSVAKEKLASTGSTRDGAAAFKEILKSRGRIKED